jgi:hypothetical protein
MFRKITFHNQIRTGPVWPGRAGAAREQDTNAFQRRYHSDEIYRANLARLTLPQAPPELMNTGVKIVIENFRPLVSWLPGPACVRCNRLI